MKSNVKQSVAVLFVFFISTMTLAARAVPTVILPIGISGSGKSFWIDSLPKAKHHVVSPDEIRKEITGSISDQSKNTEVFKEADRRTIEFLKTGKPVIFDATNLNIKLRKAFIAKLKKAVPNLKVVYKIFEANPALSKERIRNDLAAGKDRSNVPEEVIDRQFEMYKLTVADIESEIAAKEATLFIDISKPEPNKPVEDKVVKGNNDPKLQAKLNRLNRQKTTVEKQLSAAKKDVADVQKLSDLTKKLETITSEIAAINKLLGGK